MGIIAPKGSGKTTWIANVLDFFAGYFHKILVFSPTLMSDEKWDYIKKRPLLGENVALKKFLEKLDMDVSGIVGKPSVVARKTVFDPYIPDEFFMTDYEPKTLKSFMEEQMEMIERITELGGTKHIADRILILFDDLVGSKLFSGTRDNPFKVLNTTHRHHSASLVMVSQGYKEIPKTVRTNFTGLVLFEIPSEGERKAIYDENPVGMKRELWDQVYDYCTADDYSFMYVNYKRPKRLRCMKDFQQVVFVGDDDGYDEALDGDEPRKKKRKTV